MKRGMTPMERAEAASRNARTAYFGDPPPLVDKQIVSAVLDAIRKTEATDRFAEWPTEDLAAQCLMQARDNLDPEYSAFMAAVSERLGSLEPRP